MNLDLKPNPRSLNNINHTESAGKQFVSEENLQNNANPPQKDILDLLSEIPDFPGLTDMEMEANLHPDRFHEFNPEWVKKPFFLTTLASSIQ